MSRAAIVFAFCLALAGCASAPKSCDEAYDPYLVIRESLSHVPMTAAGNRLWQVPVEVNGEPGVFAVDSGSDTTIIAPQFAQKLGLLQTAAKGRFVGTNSIGQRVRYTHLTSLHLGHIAYLNFYAPILSLAHLDRALHNHFDGILGNNILRKTACTFDWNKKILTLDADATVRPAGALPIIEHQHRVYVVATANNLPVEFALDTGAYSSSITEKETARLQIPAAKKTRIEMPRVDISEISPLQQTQISLDTFQFGPVTQTNFPMLTWDENVLGMDILQSGVLTVDARNHWMCLSSPP